MKREAVRGGGAGGGAHVGPGPASGRDRIERYSEADVPTAYGDFRVVVYREWTDDGAAPRLEEHVAIVKGDVRGEDVVVRVHSECMTGEILHSLKCDCREQLDRGLQTIESEGRGAVLYLRQEGRGIGLGDKIRAYKLQERGVDTVDANRMLGLPDDSRRYHVAAFMCRDLGIRSVSLLTNNPLKVQGLRAEGIAVSQRVPVYIVPNEHNVGYLLTKSRRMRHELEIEDAPENDDAIDEALGVDEALGIEDSLGVEEAVGEDTKKVRVLRPDGTAE